MKSSCYKTTKKPKKHPIHKDWRKTWSIQRPITQNLWVNI